MNRRIAAASLCFVCLTAGLTSGQRYSLVASPDDSVRLKNGAAPKALGLVDDQESIITTPSATQTYTARPFRTFPTINVMHGDGDGNSNLAFTDPYGDLNCLMVRNRIQNKDIGPFNPEYGYNFELIVVDATGETLGRKTFQGMDQNMALSESYNLFDYMSEIYKKKFDIFLNDPEIKGALAAAAAGS